MTSDEINFVQTKSEVIAEEVRKESVEDSSHQPINEGPR